MTENKSALEPWMRGTHQDLPAVLRAVIHALELAGEDTERCCSPLTAEQWQMRIHGLAPASFQLRHIIGSIDRLLTYAEGSQLSAAQLEAMKAEGEPGTAGKELLSELSAALARAQMRVCAFAGSDLEAPRALGRKALPTSVGGLLVHVAEHTSRHVGQLVLTAKLLAARGAS